MTFFATSEKYVKWAVIEKSTMAKSSKQKFAHVYENGADFRNMSRGATIDKSTMPHGYMDAPICVVEDFFPDLP